MHVPTSTVGAHASANAAWTPTSSVSTPANSAPASCIAMKQPVKNAKAVARWLAGIRASATTNSGVTIMSSTPCATTPTMPTGVPPRSRNTTMETADKITLAATTRRTSRSGSDHDGRKKPVAIAASGIAV